MINIIWKENLILGIIELAVLNVLKYKVYIDIAIKRNKKKEF